MGSVQVSPGRLLAGAAVIWGFPSAPTRPGAREESDGACVGDVCVC